MVNFVLRVLCFLSALNFIFALNTDPEYRGLLNRCLAGGSFVYVAVRYSGNIYVTYKFDECYPYEVNGKKAEVAVFCRDVQCVSHPKADCSGGDVTPAVPLLAGLTLINAADWVRLLGKGATCQPLALPLELDPPSDET